MKTNYTLAIYGVVQKPRPFQSFVSIIYANMKDKNFLFFWRHYCVVIIVILSDSVCPCCDFSQGWAGGEKVVVSGCGLCSPGVRLALWGAGSTRPAVHSLHPHITWLWWRWQYGDNNDLILAIATVGGYLAFSSVVVYNTILWMSAWRPYVRLKPNEEVGYIREGSTK